MFSTDLRRRDQEAADPTPVDFDHAHAGISFNLARAEFPIALVTKQELRIRQAAEQIMRTLKQYFNN